MTDFIQVDLETTNRCNASCYFCPRDMTPHQGMMGPDVFEKSLERTVEFRETIALPKLGGPDIHVALCGLGEPLLNKNLAEYVRRVRSEGFYCSVSSNGALLDETRGRELLEAGMSRIDLNVGDTGDVYEDVYKLPWETTRDNVIRFAEMAKDYPDCKVQVVLVLHHDAEDEEKRKKNDHGKKMMKFWRQHGIQHFMPFKIMNRGGALTVDSMQYDAFVEVDEARDLFASRNVQPVCMAPFVFLFVGYDGQYYLCCSDWKKETPMGSVFDRSFESVFGPKLDFVMKRSTVCHTCNFDPLNRMADELRAMKRGAIDQDAVDKVLDTLANNAVPEREVLEALGLGDQLRSLEWAPRLPSEGRRTIPVTAL